MSRPRAHGVWVFSPPLIFYCPIPHPLATHTHTPGSAYSLDNTRNDLSPTMGEGQRLETLPENQPSQVAFLLTYLLPSPASRHPSNRLMATGAEKQSLSEQCFSSLCSSSPAEASSGGSCCRQIRNQEVRQQLQKPRRKVTRQKLRHQENGG